MSTSIKHSDLPLAEIIMVGIKDNFTNLRVEPNGGKLNIYTIEMGLNIKGLHYLACTIQIANNIDILIMPPVTRITYDDPYHDHSLPYGEMHNTHDFNTIFVRNREFLSAFQIEQWFTSRNIKIVVPPQWSNRIVVSFDFGDPVGLETILDWIAYCGGIRSVCSASVFDQH